MREHEIAVINNCDLLNLEKVSSDYVICEKFYRSEVLFGGKEPLWSYEYVERDRITKWLLQFEVTNRIEKNRALIARKKTILNYVNICFI